MQTTRPGMGEWQAEAEIVHEFIRHGARFPAYNSIVAGGKNACCLHYVENKDILHEGDLLLIDAGAEYQMYAGDITRTFPVNGRFSAAQKDVYEIVLAANEASIAAVHPGANWADIHAQALHILVQGLVDFHGKDFGPPSPKPTPGVVSGGTAPGVTATGTVRFKRCGRGAAGS